MATRMQRLNVRLSYILDDIVSAYTVDGQDYTSADRDLLLNTASRILYDSFLTVFDSVLERVKNRTREEPDPSVDILKDFVKLKTFGVVGKPTSGFTDYATGNTHCCGIFIDNLPSESNIRLKRILRISSNVSGSPSSDWRSYRIVPEFDVPLSFTSTDNPKHIPNIDNPVAYLTKNSTETARYVRLLPANTSGQSAMMSWLQYPNTDLTSAETEDIQWNSSFDTALLQIAHAVALRDDGDQNGYQSILQSTLMELGVVENVNYLAAKASMKGKP